MLFFLSTLLLGASATCVPDKYCQKLVGPLSYCRTWAKPATCQGSTISSCNVCGGGSSSATTITTTAPKSTARMSTSTTTRTTTTSSSARTTTTTTRMPTSTTRPTTTSSARPTTTTRMPTSTTRPTTTSIARPTTTTTTRMPTSTTLPTTTSSARPTTTTTTRMPTSTTRPTTTSSARPTTTTTTRMPTSTILSTTTSPVRPTTTTLQISTTVMQTLATCVPDKYCQGLVGPMSYCRTWASPVTCQGSTITGCNVCGAGSSTTTRIPTTTSTTSLRTSTTTAPYSTTTTPSSATRTTEIASTTFTPTRSTTSNSSNATSTFTTAISAVTVGSNSISANSALCESSPNSTVPMFLWVECPAVYTYEDFATFYAKLFAFVQSNCAGITTTTMVIRVPHPYFPRHLSPQEVYTPPSSSLVYTELISKLLMSSGNGNIKILIYPYVMDAFSRSQWVKFANENNVEPVTGTMTVWDGIFAYVNEWQNLVGSNSSVLIDGFMIDYEEITGNSETQYAVSISEAELQPYRAAYSAIKVATTVGYDDKKRINMFAAYMDYLHLQVYDLYYPFAGADRTPSSIFTTYLNDPEQLANVILTNVLMSTVLDLYQKYPNKLLLMWSTQAMTSNCIYPLNSGKCGINNEFAWSPVPFNGFMQAIMAANPVLASLPHGIYTFNFLQPEWLTIPTRYG